jgi:copper chaperone CopZ
METVNLTVSGMICGACVKHVEKAINSIVGVDKVEVDLVSGVVKVEGKLSQQVNQIIAALEEDGYPAKVRSSELSEMKSGSCSSGGSCCSH